MSHNFMRILAQGVSLGSVILLSACVGGEFSGNSPTALDKTVTGSVSVGSAQTAANAISAYRAAHGLGPVKVDASLNKLAANQARAMAVADRVGHNVPGGGSLRARTRAAGAVNAHVTENAAGGTRYRSFDAVFAGWRGSPGHNANMLQPDLTRVGIATAYAPGTKYKVFWALAMAGPRVF